MELAKIAPEQRVLKLRELIAKLPQLNLNTLKFIIEFMREVVAQEPHNRMTAYNIAVTVGPNIFRPLTVRPADLINAGTYYDAMIKMMENYEVLFEGALMASEKEVAMLAALGTGSNEDQVSQRLGNLSTMFGNSKAAQASTMMEAMSLMEKQGEPTEA